MKTKVEAISTSDEKQKQNKGESVFNKAFELALQMPGVAVDRNVFLMSSFQKFCQFNDLVEMISTPGGTAKVDMGTRNRIAEGVISYHVKIVTAIAAGLGLPGGWWMVATVPADLAQFYYHVLLVIQKLAYIYGWPDFRSEDGGIDDETKSVLLVFMGVMFGATNAISSMNKLATLLAENVAIRLPKETLTKYGIYTVSKQVVKWFGVKLTKELFAKGVAKTIPIIGAIINGTIAYNTFRPQAKLLKKHLAELPLTKPMS